MFLALSGRICILLIGALALEDIFIAYNVYQSSLVKEWKLLEEKYETV